MAGTFAQSVAVSTSITLDATNKNKMIDATAGAGGITLTVPAASGFLDGELYYIRKDDSAAGAVTLSGAFSYILVNQDQFVCIVSNTVKWRILWQN